MPELPYQKHIPTPADMLKFAATLAHACGDQGAWIYLSGDLGMGKTTFVRGFLAGLNYQERVKSPTYALIESYEINNRMIYHIDLYRMTTPADVYSLGLDDYFTDTSTCLIEWPDHFMQALPTPDLFISFSYASTLPHQTRVLTLQSPTPRGDLILKRLNE